MVQTGMTTPYTAFAQQNGGDHGGHNHGHGGHVSPLKPDMKGTQDGGGGGHPPNGVNQVGLNVRHFFLTHAI